MAVSSPALNAVTINAPGLPPSAILGSVPTGAAGRTGGGTLVAGVATISTTAVTASSQIFLTVKVAAGTLGELTVSAQTAGASFVVTSIIPGGVLTQTTDTSTFAWLVVN